MAEVGVELADGLEVLRGGETDDFVGLIPDLFQRLRRCHRDGADQLLRRALAQGMQGVAADIAGVAKDFKIYFKKVDGKTPTSYTMDHSAGSYIYDTNGRLRVYYRYGSGAEAMATDVRTLLKEAS